MKVPWLEHEIKIVQECILKEASFAEAYEIFKEKRRTEVVRTKTEVRSLYNKLNNDIDAAYDGKDPYLKKISSSIRSEVEVYLKASRPIKRMGPTMCRRIANTYFQVLDRAIANCPIPPIKHAKGSKKSGHLVEACMIDWSDLHLGAKHIDRDGKIVYNLDIAEKEMQQIVENTIRVAKLDLHSVKYDEVHLMLGGDIIDNELIYPTQVHHIDSNVFLQLERARVILQKSIMTLYNELKSCGISPKFYVHTVKGNHGRISLLADEMSNFDLILYRELELIFRLMKKYDIEFNISFTDHNIVEVKGHRGLLRHIGTKGAQTDADISKISEWCREYDTDFCVFGHYHQPGWNFVGDIPVIVNASLPAKRSNLAERMGKFQKPMQWMWRCCKDFPVNGLHRIHTDK